MIDFRDFGLRNISIVEELSEASGFSEDWIRKEAKIILESLLSDHDITD